MKLLCKRAVVLLAETSPTRIDAACHHMPREMCALAGGAMMGVMAAFLSKQILLAEATKHFALGAGVVLPPVLRCGSDVVVDGQGQRQQEGGSETAQEQHL